MPPRELSRLRSDTEKPMKEKENAVREKTNAANDTSAILRLSREARHVPISDDEALQKRLLKAFDNAKVHGAREETKLSEIDATLFGIKNEAAANLKNSNSILEKTLNTRLAGVDRRHLDKIEAGQKNNISEAKEIIAAIEGQDAKLADMLRLAEPYYYFAEKVSLSPYDKNDHIDNYTGHTMRHIVEVRGKTLDIAGSMKNIGFRDDDFFSPQTVDAAAVFHDTGMDANMKDNFFEKSGLKHVFLGNLIGAAADAEPRKKHAAVGALHILDEKNRARLSAMGANADQAAFLISLHSKTGYLEGGEARDLSKPDFADIKLAAENFAKECERTGVSWDMSWLKNGGAWNRENLRKTAITASALRLADANRDGLNLYAQKGVGYFISNAETARGRDAITDEDETHKELEGVSIAYDYGGGRLEEIKAPDGASDKQIEAVNKTRSIVFGESNIELMDLGTAQGGKLVYRFSVKEPEIGIGCTARAIQERVEEIRYTVFGNPEAFGGLASERVIEVVSDNGSTKKITGLLKDIPSGWRVADVA
jgi:hypothetical protein